MRISRFLILFAMFFLLLSPLALMGRHYVGAQEPEATLTGSIQDHGVDTDGNGLYDFLEIDVEVNVTVAGSFVVTVNGLTGEKNAIVSIGSAYAPVYGSSEGFLDVGIQYLNVSLPGTVIFSYNINPQNVSTITLEASLMPLGKIDDIPLSRAYNHTEFDPHAYLTGRILDRGVDTDGNGLFNYLEVGIEFNVTKTGDYEISVNGLIEESQTVPGLTEYLYDYEYTTGNFAAGVHTVYVNFSGPEIASRHFNPTNVSYIVVYELGNYGGQTSWLDSAPLSMRYSYGLFDAPSRDFQINFKVYPDATIMVDGRMNFTHMYPENIYFYPITANVGFSTTGNVTTETSSGTAVFPKNLYMGFDSVEAHSRSTYENGIENDTASVYVTLSPEAAAMYPFNVTDINLNAAYAGGLFDVVINGQTELPSTYNMMFPFNMSDATVMADFDGTAFGGNITFHVVPGFPLADVTVHFSGNRSTISFTGNVNVTYSSYGDFQINETILDQMLVDLGNNFTGQAVGSLYNVTGGYLECTSLDIAKTPWSNPALGADVAYNATVTGNFTGALTSMMFPPGSPAEQIQQLTYACLESTISSVRNASMILSYYHGSHIVQMNLHLSCDVQALCNDLLLLVPPTTPPQWSSQKAQIEAILRIANATGYALTDAGLSASYSSAERKISMNEWFLADANQLKTDLLPVLPDALPPNLHDLLESYLAANYSTLTSSAMTYDVINDTLTFASSATIQGDFEAGINRGKDFSIEAVESTPWSSMLPPTWELRVLNETDINMDNFQAQVDLGQDYMHLNFSGLILKPNPDDVDAITFKLKNWLDMMNDTSAPPLDYDRLSVTVTGASDGNQTVLLSQPPSVPSPDLSSLDGRGMDWNNASLFSLRDLAFLLAYDRQVNYLGGNYDVLILTNSSLTSFGFDSGAKQITFGVAGAAGEGFCNVTIPRRLLDASKISDWTVMFDGVLLTAGQFSITQNAEYAFVYLNYTHSEHVIAIRGTQLIPEYQPNIMLIVLAVTLIVTAIITVKNRRKLQLFRTKCEQMLATTRLRLKPRK